MGDGAGRANGRPRRHLRRGSEYARLGLAEQDISEARIDEYLGPIEARYDAGMTPSDWKIARVREYLDDGDDLSTAIQSMQRDYIAASREYHSFEEWL